MQAVTNSTNDDWLPITSHKSLMYDLGIKYIANENILQTGCKHLTQGTAFT